VTDQDALARYRGRRDFTATAEPRGEAAAAGGTPSFVVQIHDARRMHFDVRLEVDGVLKSWAVPKGPSPDPADKRLAVPTEDHPLDYRDFEGVIPAGEYGGGTVIVWDSGTYRPLAGHRGPEISVSAFAENLARGHGAFRLHGTKLHGGYSLTRTGDRAEGEEEYWLLVKHRDAAARRGHGTPDPRRARSVRSGRTLGQMRAEGDRGKGR
jgi:DNA ligase D-like protein (predicted 3'-phosphoesterase)